MGGKSLVGITVPLLTILKPIFLVAPYSQMNRGSLVGGSVIFSSLIIQEYLDMAALAVYLNSWR
jgi:hypothetical protein